jgi:phosphate:Na+ symporter
MSGTELFATFLGSVALLLWGVRMVRTGMMRAFGAALRRIISTRTRTRMSAFLAGVGVTGILQSSTATALLLASFAGRGLIALPLALAVMLGADVGSSIAAQAFSFDIKWLWTLLVALDGRRQGARCCAHLDRPWLHAARAVASRRRGRSAQGIGDDAIDADRACR